MKKVFSRLEVQSILESNKLKSEVTYLEREDTNNPENYIVYYRLAPNSSTLYADDKIHLRKAYIQVSHFHKRKLDSIEDILREHFNVEPAEFLFKQTDTDYWSTIYRFEIFIKGAW